MKQIDTHPWTIVNGWAGELPVWSCEVHETKVVFTPPDGGVPREDWRFTSNRHVANIRDVVGHHQYDANPHPPTDDELRAYIHRGFRVKLSDLMYDDDGLSEAEREQNLAQEREDHLAAGGCPGCDGQVNGQHRFGCSVRGRGGSMFTSGFPARQRADGEFEITLPVGSLSK